MSEEKSTVPTFIAAVIGAALLIAGISRANKNNTSAWEEMFNILKDICHWVFAALFAIVIIGIIFYILRATLERVREAYVSWKKSKDWCDTIENSFQENKLLAEKQDEQNVRLKSYCNSLSHELRLLKTELEEVKKVTGFNIKKAESNAENEILDNA